MAGWRRPTVALRCAAALLACGLGVAGCGGGPGSSANSSPSPAATIETVHVAGLGRLLAGGDGHVLYMFVPDHRKKVTCTGGCADTWPPAAVPNGITPKAGSGVRQGLLGTVANPNADGERVVTYNRWPLYTYLPDTKPRMASGQAVDLNGGLWYVMRASGKIVKRAAGEHG